MNRIEKSLRPAVAVAVAIATLLPAAPPRAAHAAPASPSAAPATRVAPPPAPEATAVASPRVAEFSPRGDVKQVRQVTVRFSTPMVALGDPRAIQPPLAVRCPEPGAGRWIDSRTFAWDFTRALPGGLRCEFDLRPGLTDLAGTAVAGERSFSFSTGGPAVLSSWPSEGSEVAEDQAFVLVLDAEAAPETIARDAWFTAEGIAERIGLRIASDATREAILATRPGWKPDGPVIVVEATQRFPAEVPVKLVWGRGVATPGGLATDTDQVLDFTTRPAFVAEIRCQRENARAGCIPLTPIAVAFTASISAADAARIALVAPDGRRFTPSPPDDPNPLVSRATFRGPFPESTSLRVDLPADLRDDAGRPLVNAAEMQSLEVRVDANPPLAKFAARFGILEARADPALPIAVRGLEPEAKTRLLELGYDPAGKGAAPIQGTVTRLPSDSAADVLQWLLRVGSARREKSIFAGTPPIAGVQSFDLKSPSSAETELIGIPLPRPGVYVVQIESVNLGRALLDANAPMYVTAAALVTDLAVHLEWSPQSSLVWVTTLEKGKPAAGAEVAVHDCAGKVLWQGRTGPDGLARIPSLPSESDLPRCREPDEGQEYDPYRDYMANGALNGLAGGLFVTARLGDDLSFVHSSWNDGIEPFRFNLPTEPWQGPFVAHSVLARNLLRAGEPAQMKHVFRRQTLQGFAVAGERERPTRVSIRHDGSDTRYEFPLSWSPDGSAETTWAIPREAKLGRYEIVLVRPGAPTPAADARPTPTPAPPYAWLGGPDDASAREWVAGELRVEEFRVPLLRATVKLPPGPEVAPPEVPVDIGVQYLAGGGAGGLPIVLRSRLVPAAVSLPADLGFDGFEFANGAVKPGITREDEDADCCAGGEGAEPDGPGGRAVLQREEIRLDGAGTARATLRGLAPPTTPQDLRVEAEFRDPNGEAQTASASLAMWPSSVLAGVRAETVGENRQRILARVAAIDAQRKPVAGVPVVVEALERVTYTNRQRVVGGFYSYQDVTEVRRLRTLCRGRTGSDGRFSCRRTPRVEGNLIVQARLVDPQGRASVAHQDVWIAGERELWFSGTDSDRMDVLPERRRWEPGETARLQVRMPFRRATALVTVAREGVLDARVVELSGKNPTIEVPVRGSFAPNMYVQVLALRGRVAAIQPTSLVDLGRPTFKLGIAELDVGWRDHELAVRVEPDREVYRVRETSRVKIAVRALSGEPLPAGATVAVAAIDEGLLELVPNTSWKLLPAMMARRGYGLSTATAQMQIVGKRHFGKKAVPTGGGGGRQATRELFDTLLFWRGDVRLAADGTAEIEIPLNDSLTGFRIAAVATAGTGEFGTGEASIRATQDLMLFSGLPPLVRAGDRFRAEFTVRNTTDHAVDIEVRGNVPPFPPDALAPRALQLAPGEAKVAGWEVVAPEQVSKLLYTIEATVRGGATDRMTVAQHVVPAVRVRTLQSTLRQWTGPPPISEPVALPEGALPGRGGVSVALSPSLTAGLAGVREWMTRYPYTCLEQRVSRAVALEDPTLWGAVTRLLPAYLDDAGLLKFFPNMPRGSEVLTAYVLQITRAAKLALPDDVEPRMKSGLRQFATGSLTPRPGPLTSDLPLRKLAAVAALAVAGETDPQLVSGLTIEPQLWPTSAVLDWWAILRATPQMPDRAARLAEVAGVLRARLDLQGTVLAFTPGSPSSPPDLLSGSDVDALRLVLLATETRTWPEDLPRLMRGALARQERGHWSGTVANAWGVVATNRFAGAFERGRVDGETVARLGATDATVDWTRDPKGATVDLPWPPAPAPLVVEHRGGGRPWLTIAARAALPLREPLFAGYRITRTVEPLERRDPARWSVGDTMRVRLEIDAAADLPWVVVDEPLPGGASYLARGFATDSQIAAPTPAPDTVLPTFEEKSFAVFRAYFERVPAGRFSVEYAIRLNQSGRFQLPPTHVEALYAPEAMGELPNQPIEVDP